MNISKVALVSNSAMIKNYKACREKAEDLDKLYILKNNQLDAVLFSMAKYEKLSVFIEYVESLSEDGIGQLMKSLPKDVPNDKKDVQIKLDDIKNEVVEGHRKIMSDIGKLPKSAQK